MKISDIDFSESIEAVLLASMFNFARNRLLNDRATRDLSACDFEEIKELFSRAAIHLPIALLQETQTYACLIAAARQGSREFRSLIDSDAAKEVTRSYKWYAPFVELLSEKLEAGEEI